MLPAFEKSIRFPFMVIMHHDLMNKFHVKWMINVVLTRRQVAS